MPRQVASVVRGSVLRSRLRPLDNAGHTHPKHGRRRPARPAACNRTNHRIPQVLRIGSCHLMLAPSPSQHLESQDPKYGILPLIQPVRILL
jgi:hypothetical protein